MDSKRVYRLLISCPDRVGVVARVSAFIAELGGWITESDYHSDPASGWFFMRNEIRADSLRITLSEFRNQFNKLADEFTMSWRITDSTEKPRLVIMASHESHCLADLLYRWSSGELECDIVRVISNHSSLGEITTSYKIPFDHLPYDSSNSDLHFKRVESLWKNSDADLIALARYMRILPSDICARWAGKIINIHHSFLPSFAGARPYHQACERGVKLIGATCHYVTADLDEGPIIEQEVARVNHRDSLDDMIRLGRDVEKTTLARGVRYHLEDRVVIHQNKTIVFA